MATGRAAASINPTLTAYAQGLAQDLRSAVAEFMAPTVRVPASIGQYKDYDDKNAFQLYATGRALGGPATRIKFEASDQTFNCKPQALEVTIDDAERAAAGDSDPLGLEQSKVATLVSSTTIAHEDAVMTAVKAGATAVAGKGVWSSANNDPVAEIDEQIEALATVMGMMPNRIAFGIGAWRVFRNHPNVIKRFPGAALVGVSMDQALGLFLNPGMAAMVGVLSKDSTKWGQTKDAANIFGAEVFIFFASASPTVYDASFAKTFMGGSGGITAVREYRDESARSDVYAIDWSRDIKITGSACVKRLTIK